MNNNIICEFEKLKDHIKKQIEESYGKEKTKHAYRLKQISNIITIIKLYQKKIKSGSELAHLEGVGKGTVRRIDEILKNGYLKELHEDNGINYKAVRELEQIHGIGTIKAIELVKQGVKSIDHLQQLITDNKLQVSDYIMKGLKYYGKIKEDIPREEMLIYDEILHKAINQIDKTLHGVVAGSYRRQKLTSNDIDFLITTPNIHTINQLETTSPMYNPLYKLILYLHQNNILIDDLTDKDINNKYMGYSQLLNKAIRRIDIRLVPYESYYPALLYMTGSGNFNAKMREVAKQLDYKLNEYGLFKEGKMIPINSEKDIFDVLGMEWVNPENR